MIGTFLILTASGCSNQPIVTTKTEVQKVPAALLSPCPKSGGAKTYSDAIKLAEERGKELDFCNERLKAIEQWSAGS